MPGAGGEPARPEGQRILSRSLISALPMALYNELFSQFVVNESFLRRISCSSTARGELYLIHNPLLLVEQGVLLRHAQLCSHAISIHCPVRQRQFYRASSLYGYGLAERRECVP